MIIAWLTSRHHRDGCGTGVGKSCANLGVMIMVGRLIKQSWIIFVIAALFCSGHVLANGEVPEKEPDLFAMPIEQLLQVEVYSTATLTETRPRIVPAAMTTITEEQLLASGARSLFELLDIYVPNLQWIRHHWEADHLGLRGIINDRDDKYLLLVNGRVMNERTHYGAVSERDLVLLRDIHHIDIVRGPGSAMYGPGAVSMVINIITHNAETFQGTEVTGRLGAIEEFYSGEVKHGRKFKDGDGGYFAYFGVAEYDGADKHDAPQIFAGDTGGFMHNIWGAPSYLPVQEAGEPYLDPSINNDGETWRGLPPIKIYAELTKGNWDVWGRYTRGGQQFVWDPRMLTSSAIVSGSWGEHIPLIQSGTGYQQATGYIGYNREFNERTNLEASFSYDMFDFERFQSNNITDAYREDKYISKAIIRHDINKKHKIAFGAEILHGEYGYESPGWPAGVGATNSKITAMPRWSTNMFSFMGEHQWAVCDKVTTFLGARLDDHTYSKIMFSPRAAIVVTPTKKDTLKVMWARSVRANFEEEMRSQVMAGSSDDGNPEILDSIEFRWERKHNKNLDLAISVFRHYNLELISYNPGEGGGNIPLGTQKEWGIEVEALYHTDRTRLAISHGYTKLYDYNTGAADTYTTANPYGYGDDLAQWSNHITKITAQRKLNDRWTLDGSLRIYWGFPGMEDMDDYQNTASCPWKCIYYEQGWEKAYRGNYYLNLGLQYQPNKNLTFRVDGYNLLGVFNHDLNKRNYYAGYGDYRCHAAAVGVTVIWLMP